MLSSRPCHRGLAAGQEPPAVLQNPQAHQLTLASRAGRGRKGTHARPMPRLARVARSEVSASEHGKQASRRVDQSNAQDDGTVVQHGRETRIQQLLSSAMTFTNMRVARRSVYHPPCVYTFAALAACCCCCCCSMLLQCVAHVPFQQRCKASPHGTRVSSARDGHCPRRPQPLGLEATQCCSLHPVSRLNGVRRENHGACEHGPIP